MAPDKMALRLGNWKLLLNASDKDAEEAKGSDKAIGKMELYNLANDIAEKNNLAKTQPEKLAEMHARLDALLQDAVPAGGTSEIAPTKKGKKGKGKK
jgi:hypothetical protein